MTVKATVPGPFWSLSQNRINYLTYGQQLVDGAGRGEAPVRKSRREHLLPSQNHLKLYAMNAIEFLASGMDAMHGQYVCLSILAHYLVGELLLHKIL